MKTSQKITACPKFNNCNATICPVDPDWQRRSNQQNDSTCFYLTESIKHGARTHFEQAGLYVLHKNILTVREAIITTHPRIKNALERAALTGSRMTRKIGKAC